MDIVISIFLIMFIISFPILLKENINKDSLFFQDIHLKNDTYFSYGKIFYAISRSIFRAIFISAFWTLILMTFYGFYLLIVKIFDQNNINLFLDYFNKAKNFIMLNYDKLLVTNLDNFNPSLFIALVFSLYAIISLIIIYLKNIITETINESPSFKEYCQLNHSLDKEISLMLNPDKDTLKSFQLKKDFILKNFIFFENINHILCIFILFNVETNEHLNLFILIISLLIISYSTTLRTIGNYLSILKTRLNLVHKIQFYFISPLISISTIYVGFLNLESNFYIIVYILIFTTLLSFLFLHFGEKIRKNTKNSIEKCITDTEMFKNFLMSIKSYKKNKF